MRSQKTLNYWQNTSAYFKKSPLRLSLIICCAFICPNFVLHADTTAAPVLAKPHQTSSRTKVYFYNPEINIARNLVLKNAWDNYLYEMGYYELQPVDNGESFTKLIHQEEDAAFIMAEWLYASLSSSSEIDKQHLELAFVGVKNGSDTYRKILVANKSSLNFENVTIASSGSKERARKVLSSIYPEYSTQQLESMKVLSVPKDIDALMAVGYGLAEMALTTEVSLSKIALLNEHLYKDLLVLRKSEPFKRSVLVLKSNNIELKTAIVNVLSNMNQHPKGQQAMSLLGLDEWKSVDKKIAKLPENLINISNSDGGQSNDN